MPYIKHPKSLYMHAHKNHYIMPACHISGLASLHAILDGAQRADSPIVLQIGRPAYDIFQPFDSFFSHFKNVCDEYDIPVLLNHDHIPSVDLCKQVLEAGFPSVMFDGSHLPYEENIAATREVVQYAHERGAWVEAELGNIPGFEDMVFAKNTVYTEPEKALDFIRQTGCDSLAVAVGTAHGGVKAGHPLEIDFDLLARIYETVGEYPLVLHGAASLLKELIDRVNQFGGQADYLDMCTESTIAKTRMFGITKANMDVDNMLVITGALREHFVRTPDNYNHIKYMKEVQQALSDEIQRKIKNVTCSGGFGRAYLERKER